jgi:hypothetical protein
MKDKTKTDEIERKILTSQSGSQLLEKIKIIYASGMEKKIKIRK